MKRNQHQPTLFDPFQGFLRESVEKPCESSGADNRARRARLSDDGENWIAGRAAALVKLRGLHPVDAKAKAQAEFSAFDAEPMVE